MQDRQWPALHFVYFGIHDDPIDVPYSYIPSEAKEQPLNLGKAFLKKCSCTIGVHNTDQQAVHPTEHVGHTATEEPTVTDALAGDECKAKKPHKPPSAQRWPARLHRLLETEVIYARIAKLQKLLGWAKPPRPKSRTAVTWSCTSWRGSFGPRSPRNDFNDFFRAFLHCGRQV